MGQEPVMWTSRSVDGVLLLDKPSGPSSNQALQRVKRLFAARKAGHAGTLDPIATGLLPILLGEATKFSSYSLEAAKEYEATVLLGVRTTTGDLEGEVLRELPVEVNVDELEAALARFRGPIMQTPPMHSALKKDGQPLYRLARRGEHVAREARPVEIHRLDLVGVRGNEVDLVVACSKGTYIRVLAEDIGAALGCGATLKQLRRTRVGAFHIGQAVTLDALEAMTDEERVAMLLPADAGLEHLGAVRLSAFEARLVRNGQPVEIADPSRGRQEGPLRLYASDRFLGLGESRSGRLYPLRLIAGAERQSTNSLRACRASH